MGAGLPNATVRALVVYNGEVVAGVQGNTGSHVYRWDGAAWQALGGGAAN